MASGSLESLSVELLQQIILDVLRLSKATVFSLLRVNKSLYEITLPIAFQELQLDITEEHSSNRADSYWSVASPKNLERMETMLRNSNDKHKNPFRYVRRIVVTSSAMKFPTPSSASMLYFPDSQAVTELFSRWKEYNEHRWSVFVTLLSRVPRIWELIIDCGSESIPLTLLQALHTYHPSCHLHLRNWAPYVGYSDSKDPFLEEVAKSPCLRSILGSDVSRYGPNLAFQDLTFERVISLAPNLGWSQHERERNLPEWKHYHAGNNPSRKLLRTLIWKASLSLSQFRRLERFIDFTHTETLDLGAVWNSDLFEIYPSQSTTTDITSGATATSTDTLEKLKSTISNFIFSCPPLISLHIINYHDVVDILSILLTHGDSLRSLSLHQIEHCREARPILWPEDIELIFRMAPRLRSLGLDINRSKDGELEKEIYEVLQSSTSLERLSLNYDLYNPYFNFWEQQYDPVKENFGREVWDALHNDALIGSPDAGILRLFLSVGYPPRDGEINNAPSIHRGSERKIAEIGQEHQYSINGSWTCELVYRRHREAR
ncbi:hypothetical protein AAF712_009176 [Marasmius tenuissimus]|uniref:F-box domain-containing protein n=1 Tax=Marasmius tenuissimus TaxID=585030 RepID=A0ABR2ZSR4_9AGAR